MNATELLLMELITAYEMLEGTIADVKDEHLHTHSGKAGHIAANAAHIALGADSVIHGMLQGKPALSETTFKGKTGTNIAYPPYEADKIEHWMKSVKVDMKQLKTYSQAVQKSAEEYVATLSEEDLDRKVKFEMLGDPTVGWLLGNFIIGHINSHCGEIAVLKGLHGEKGYPF